MNASSDKLQIREAMYLGLTGHRGLTWGMIGKLGFLAKTEVQKMVKFKLREVAGAYSTPELCRAFAAQPGSWRLSEAGSLRVVPTVYPCAQRAAK